MKKGLGGINMMEFQNNKLVLINGVRVDFTSLILSC